MRFRDREKARYQRIKGNLFSEAAQAEGHYAGRLRAFCLADGYSAENLHVSLREEMIRYFRDRDIPWHDGQDDGNGRIKGLPSNHLCCSQCGCVNALGPMVRDGDLLGHVFGTFLPDLAEVLPFDADDPLPDGSRPFLAFEWIGTKGTNYLGEVGSRSRGANATSADFAFRFRRRDGRIQLVLGEWKYTEYYATRLAAPDKLNKTRLRVYRAAFDRWRGTQPGLPEYKAFFAEPFYQLMRLTLLAQEMEVAGRAGAGEMQADVVSVIHVAPKANRDFAGSFTSEAFRRYGSTLTEAWAGVCGDTRFLAIPSESVLTAIEKATASRHRLWADWLLRRYGWWTHPEQPSAPEGQSKKPFAAEAVRHQAAGGVRHG